MNAPMTTAPNAALPIAGWREKAKRALTEDMTPEEWRGLVEGLLEFLAEEAEEPEHQGEDVEFNEADHPRAPDGKFGSGGGNEKTTAPDFSKLTEAKRKWQAAEFNYAKNPINTMKVRLEKARSEYEKEKRRNESKGKDHEMDCTEDEAAALALDRESVREKDIDGRLHVQDVPLCRESVDPYKGSEIPGYRKLGLEPEKIYRLWRPADELEKAVATINGIPMLRKHVATSAQDHKFKDTIGSTGTSARWEAPFIKDELVIWAAPDIELIENREKFALSPGYRYEPVMEAGDFEGQHYDGRMTKIVFNHVAVVEHGRQAEVAIDSADELQWRAIERAITALAA